MYGVAVARLLALAPLVEGLGLALDSIERRGAIVMSEVQKCGRIVRRQ